MRKCPKCGREFASNERICPDDSAVLQETVSSEERAIGRVLDGKYKIEGFLKRGGMGSVYRGTHLLLNKPVAIKLIRPELVTSHDMVERFFREARAAAKLSHPNIVTVHDLGQEKDGTLYIIMEIVDGKSLKEHIQAEGAWEASRALRFIKGVASALSLAHRNDIVHRDLKPQNIMVSRDSEGNESGKLLDFGIAKTLEPDSPALTATGMVLGTPHYMSSEQAKGLPADPRSDIYALGVILYEMLVGKVPFDDKSIPSILVKHLTEVPRPPSTLKTGIPPEVEALVLRCLEKDPDHRIQSADELGKVLSGLVGTEAHRVLDPTVGMAPTVADPQTAPAVTMAGGASAARSRPVPFPPPVPVPEDEPTKKMDSGTVRAREIRGPASHPPPSRTGHGSLGAWLAIAVLGFLFLGVVGASAFFLLRGRTRTPEPEPVVTAAVLPEAETPSDPAPEPAAEQEPPSEPPVSEPAVPAAGPRPASVRAEATTPPRETVVEAPVVRRQPPPPPPPEPERAPVPPAEPPMPDKPLVSIECEGVRDACGVIRVSLREALERRGIRVGVPVRADVLVNIDAEEIEARTEQQFGNTFVIRTYSVSGDVEVPRFADSVSLPPRTFSFDARLGREKLRGEAHVIALGAAERIERYWEAKRRER